MFKRIITSVTFAAMLLSCSPKYVKPTAADGSNADANIDFAIEFFKNTSKTVAQDENLVVSPYSAAVALSMLEEGAQGQTKAEFDDVLGGCLYQAENLGGGEDLTVKSANSLWISDDFSVRNRYVSLLEKYYDALVTTQNFNDPATVKEINNWCSENTAGKIDKIIDELSPNDVMVLINALYFNAPWAEAFDSKGTVDDVFHAVSGDKTVPMMYRKAKYDYAEYQGGQIIRLPYKGERYSMVIVLPPEGMSLSSVLPFVNTDVYNTAMGMLSNKEVAFRMPKFRLETELVLDKALQKMGIKTAYSPAADFTAISESGPLSIGTVKQKCYIDVTEKGTEAAAVTSVQVRLTSVSVSPRMTVDRPFIFLITDSQTNNILFMGKVVNL